MNLSGKAGVALAFGILVAGGAQAASMPVGAGHVDHGSSGLTFARFHGSGHGFHGGGFGRGGFGHRGFGHRGFGGFGHRGFGHRGYYGRRFGYGRQYYGYRQGYYGYGPGLGFGLAAGALLGGALAAPAYAPAPGYGGSFVAYCSRKYRSFDPRSGTYLGYDGHRHACVYP